MARTKDYPHYCAAARSLEVIGEKWSLLIVRDLLFGPQRFTDLLELLGGITPKWLTQRLRDLEATGIVEREQTAGKREVWYRLTPKGEALAPVLDELTNWGVTYGRPPEPGEAVHPRRAIAGTAAWFNHHGVKLPRPMTVLFAFAPGETHALRYDGERWLYGPDHHDGEIRIETKPEVWTSLPSVPPDERRRLLKTLRITGDSAAIAEFQAALGRTRIEQ